MFTRFLIVLAVSSFAIADEPQVFRKLDLDAALEAAKRENKLVLVYFVTLWSKHSDFMDRMTWADEDVIEWVDKHGIVIRVDADQQPALTRSFGVESFPTLVFLRPDRSVVAQMVGWVYSFDLIDRWKQIAANPERDFPKDDPKSGNLFTDPDSRMHFGEVLHKAGKHAEALESYLWAFDHGELRPSFAGVRLSYLLSDIRELGEEYPPAMQALRERRDSREARIRNGESECGLCREYLRLNEKLGDDLRTVQLHDAQPAGSQARRYLFDVDLFAKVRRYEEVLQGVDPLEYFEDGQERFGRTCIYSAGLAKQTVVNHSAPVYEALIATRRTKQAAALANAMIDYAPTGYTYAVLIRHAARAGVGKLAESLAKRGIDTLKESHHQQIRSALQEVQAAATRPAETDSASRR